MKNNLKEKIFKNFLFIFEKELPELSEATKRKLSNALVESCYQVFINNSEELIKQNTECINNLEKNRKQFKDFVDVVQKSTDKLMVTLNSEKFVTKEYNNKSGEYFLKPRTNMVNEMVQYLNTIDPLVISFYKNVYKIEQTTIDYPKISLF
jgi:hypothetical protein